MTKVYIEQCTEHKLPLSFVFWPNLTFPLKAKRLFLQEIMETYQQPFFDITEDIASADFVAVPHDYFDCLRYAPHYLLRMYRLAQEAKKKILLFEYTDYVDTRVEIPEHAVLFRVSVYRHHKKTNEIVMPYFIEDIGANHTIGPKEKGTPISVGYCGQARFKNTLRKWRGNAKRLLQVLMLMLQGDAQPFVHACGIFWRSKAIVTLRKGGIRARILERSFYSLFDAGEFDPKRNREEYIENLRDSDLALCARGDANQSQRFYEALSASRVPLYLDTDTVLPLEEALPYEEVVLFVPSQELQSLPARVRAFDKEVSKDAFLLRQKKARKLYEELRLDRYFERVFDREKSPYRDILFS